MDINKHIMENHAAFAGILLAHITVPGKYVFEVQECAECGHVQIVCRNIGVEYPAGCTLCGKRGAYKIVVKKFNK